MPAKKKSIQFSESTLRAIHAVNQDVAYDIEFEEGESYKEQCLIIAETCLDARRMTMSGYPEADAEVDALVKEHGYMPVLKEAAKHVSVA